MRKLLIAFSFLLAYVVGMAQTFEVKGIYYQIKSETELTVRVCNNPSSYQKISYVIPEKVTYEGKDYIVDEIGAFSFDECSVISVILPKTVVSIGENAFFRCTKLTSIEIPNSVISIGEGAFCFCEGLTSIEIPNSVTSIGEYAFSSCSGLTSIVIPNSVISIGDGAFKSCSSLDSVAIGNSVVSIGEGAFNGCSSLTSIAIPYSVSTIGKDAFYNCRGMADIYNYSAVPQSGNGNILYTCNIHVKNGLKNTYASAEEWRHYNIIDDIYALTSFTLNKQEICCAENDTVSLYIETFEPANATLPQAILTSSDPSVVKVLDNNRIQGLKKGKATITATAMDGSGVTAQCEVYVGILPVSISALGNGSVTLLNTLTTFSNEEKNFELSRGSKVTINFAPEKGYKIASLIVNGEDVTADVANNAYTISTSLDSPQTISVTFEACEIYDVNQDGLVNSADVVSIYNRIINGK